MGFGTAAEEVVAAGLAETVMPIGSDGAAKPIAAMAVRIVIMASILRIIDYRLPLEI